MTATDTILSTRTLTGHDDDGQPEVRTVTVAATPDGYEVEHRLGGECVDSEECDSRTEAQKVAARMVREIEREFADAARCRAADRRADRKAALLELAGSFDGLDAAAVGLVARLVGKGRAADVIRALRAAGLA